MQVSVADLEPGNIVRVDFLDHCMGPEANVGPVKCRSVGIVDTSTTPEWLVLSTWINADESEERGRDQNEHIGILTSAITDITKLRKDALQ